MSGHNKWSQIKHQKEKTDAYKSKLFSKFAKLLSVEAKKARGDMSAPGLRAVIEKARAANMPSDNIERAVKKATADNSAALEGVVYEAYGPGGAAIVIEALTDNRNKAAQEVKHILSQHGSSLAAMGSASWAFEKTAEGLKPTATIPLSDADADALGALIAALEESDEIQEVYTNAE